MKRVRTKLITPPLHSHRDVLRPVRPSPSPLSSTLTLPSSFSGKDYEFLSLSQELAAPGEMRQAQTFEFTFKNVEKQYESYSGINVKLRYFLRVTIARRMGDVVKEREIWVHSYRMPPDSNMAIKMEVGIEDCLHIEFEYNKAKYVFSSSPCDSSNAHPLFRFADTTSRTSSSAKSTFFSSGSRSNTWNSPSFVAKRQAHRQTCIMRARRSPSSRLWTEHRCAVRLPYPSSSLDL